MSSRMFRGRKVTCPYLLIVGHHTVESGYRFRVVGGREDLESFCREDHFESAPTIGVHEPRWRQIRQNHLRGSGLVQRTGSSPPTLQREGTARCLIPLTRTLLVSLERRPVSTRSIRVGGMALVAVVLGIQFVPVARTNPPIRATIDPEEVRDPVGEIGEETEDDDCRCCGTVGCTPRAD